jgi:hypothetical protein
MIRLKRATIFVVDSWRYVMDVRFNPLRFIGDPSLQMYFTLALFTMWSAYFGFIASHYLGLVNYSTLASIFIHLAIIIPIGFTNAVFMDAERAGSKWLREWRKKDSL